MTKHLKRLNAPRSWKIARKTNVYTTRPRPGAHPMKGALPLKIVLRDILKLAQSSREAGRAIGGGDILVDGRLIKDPKFAVGFMDVISIPKVKQSWRVMYDDKARLVLSPIEEKQATWKLCRILGKTTVTGGRTQLNLHDGRNLLVKKDDYKTGDTLRLEIPSQKIVGHFPFQNGAQVLITGGQHAGEIAPIKEIETTRSQKANLVHLTRGEEGFTTVKPYAFPIGEMGNLPKQEVKRVV
jgi:small subunit ribosomal protein S4e